MYSKNLLIRLATVTEISSSLQGCRIMMLMVEKKNQQQQKFVQPFEWNNHRWPKRNVREFVWEK